MTQIQMADGTIVGTGLQMPVAGKVSVFAAYEASGPMLTKSQIVKIAKSGEMDGRKKFDKTWVEYQRHYGSCNGFSEATAMSKARVRRGLKRVDLSGAYAYSLINGGTDRGSQLEDGMNAAMRRGIATKATVPWNCIYPHLYDQAKANAEAEKFKALECYAVHTAEGYFSALASGFDVVTAVHAGNQFMRVDGEGVAGVDRGPGNHAVNVDGIAWAGELVGTGQNSWNTTYGIEGRMLLTEAHYYEPSRYHMTYAMRTTIDSDDGEDGDELPTVEA